MPCGCTGVQNSPPWNTNPLSHCTPYTGLCPGYPELMSTKSLTWSWSCQRLPCPLRTPTSGSAAPQCSLGLAPEAQGHPSPHPPAPPPCCLRTLTMISGWGKNVWALLHKRWTEGIAYYNGSYFSNYPARDDRLPLRCNHIFLAKSDTNFFRFFFLPRIKR